MTDTHSAPAAGLGDAAPDETLPPLDLPPAVFSEANPVLAEATRGERVESVHRGAVAVMTASGTVAASWGDIDRPTYGRSAIKSLQAIPLVESGAADHYRLGDREIAIACASHGGEPEHVATVKAWLNGLGMPTGSLECGSHLPSHEPAAIALMRSGADPTPLHNNCSGKHAGFLCTAKHLGDRTDGYVEPDHPAMRRWFTVLSEMADTDLTGAPRGIDGCSIPVIGMTLRATARAMARIADPAGLSAGRRAAVERIRAANATEPFMVAGTGRFCTVVMQALGARALVKTGAEGFFCAALPERGLGIALKIDDGASRAAEVAMGALLRHFGVIDAATAEALQGVLRPWIRNRRNRIVGYVRALPQWMA